MFISCVRTRNEPKKASGGGVVRKVFRYCGFNHIDSPTLSHPPPDPLPAGVGSQVLVDFLVNPIYLYSDYRKSFDRGRERYIGEGGSKSG